MLSSYFVRNDELNMFNQSLFVGPDLHGSWPLSKKWPHVNQLKRWSFQLNCSTSTVYWCIASKLKVPLIFLLNEQNVCVCWFKSLFNQSYSGGIATTKKPTGYWRYYHSRWRGSLAAMGLAMEPGVHVMSDELILKILCNIFLAFKWILMMRSGQNISLRWQCSEW